MIRSSRKQTNRISGFILTLLLLCGSPLLSSCDNINPDQPEVPGNEGEAKVYFTVTLDLSEGNLFTRGGDDYSIFTSFYDKMKSGDQLAESYELEIANMSTSAVYHVSGRWVEHDPVTLPAGVYKITGSSKAEGGSIQDRCSLLFEETVTVHSGDTNIVLHGIYDSSLLIINSDEITEIINFDGVETQPLFTFDTYRYAYFRDNLYLEGHKEDAYMGGTFRNGSNFRIPTGNLSFKKGSYYVISSLNYEIQLPLMDEGWIEEQQGINDSEMQVTTMVAETDQQPFLAGGYIANYDATKIRKKGVIVSKSAESLYVSEQTAFDQPLFEGSIKYPYSHEETGRGDYIFTKNTWILDCTFIAGEEYLYSIKYLDGDCDYFIRAFAIDDAGNVIYGDQERVHTQSFNREDGRVDFANVWYYGDYTLFDLVSDEVISSPEGYYYSTNEYPDEVGFGMRGSACYKFATERNYLLWRCQDARHIEMDKIASRPVMSVRNNKLYLTPAPADAEKGIIIYYSVNGLSLRSENFTDIYSSPIDVKKGDIVHCYALSSDNNISFTNSYVVM